MKVYTYSEARQNLAALLDEASRTGSVEIRRKDGSRFVLQPRTSKKSSLDVPGVDLGLSREEIVELIHEGRREG